MPTTSVKPSKPQNMITKHQTKEATSNNINKILASSKKRASTCCTKQHQEVNSSTLQSTSETT